MRYVLHPGYVLSQTDKEAHYIGAPLLIRLYGLRGGDKFTVMGPGFHSYPGDVHLHPRFDGRYKDVHFDEG